MPDSWSQSDLGDHGGGGVGNCYYWSLLVLLCGRVGNKKRKYESFQESPFNIHCNRYTYIYIVCLYVFNSSILQASDISLNDFGFIFDIWQFISAKYRTG